MWKIGINCYVNVTRVQLSSVLPYWETAEAIQHIEFWQLLETYMLSPPVIFWCPPPPFPSRPFSSCFLRESFYGEVSFVGFQLASFSLPPRSGFLCRVCMILSIMHCLGTSPWIDFIFLVCAHRLSPGSDIYVTVSSMALARSQQCRNSPSNLSSSSETGSGGGTYRQKSMPEG